MFELSKKITKVFIMIFFRMFPSGQGRVRFSWQLLQKFALT